MLVDFRCLWCWRGSRKKVSVCPLTGEQVPLNALVKQTTEPTAVLAVNHQSQFPSVTLSFNDAGRRQSENLGRADEVPHLRDRSQHSDAARFRLFAGGSPGCARLPPTQRRALVTVLSDSSYQAAAGSCRCQIGTIKSRVSRARTTLVHARRALVPCRGVNPVTSATRAKFNGTDAAPRRSINGFRMKESENSNFRRK